MNIMKPAKIKSFHIMVALLVGAFLMVLALWNVKSIETPKTRKLISSNTNNTRISHDKVKNYILFDLGSNNGDSILSFFELQPRFPQFLEGSLTYKRFGPEATAAKWKIYAFEANPKFDSDLDETVARLKQNTKHEIQVFKKTAAWIYDGTIGFYVENATGYGLGSSLDKKHKDVVKSGSVETIVSCRDIASMIKSLDHDDFIVVKIDIEGAEYELILDFIKKDAVRWVDHFAIEYHKEMRKFDSPEATLNSVLKLFGATSSDWI